MHFLFFSKALSSLGLSALASAVSAAEGATQRSLSDHLSWVQLVWGYLQRYAKTTTYKDILIISFLSPVRAFASWQSVHLLDSLKELEICLKPKYVWLSPEKSSFWFSSAARFFGFCILVNQLALIRRFWVLLILVLSSCSILISTVYNAVAL